MPAPAVVKKKQKGYDKKPKIDYGTHRDWLLRLKNCLVQKGDDFFYIQDIIQERAPACKKKTRELAEAISLAEEPVEKRRLRRLYDAHVASGEMVTSAYGYFCTEKPDRKRSTHVPVDELTYDLLDVGFVNPIVHEGSSSQVAVFISRLAIGTSYKQGLCKGNTTQTCSLTSKNLRPGADGMSMTSPALIKSLNRSYPTLREALETAFSYDKASSVAFSQNYAVKVDEIGHITLLHRTRTVGSSYDEGETFKLLGRFVYLKEELINLGVSIKNG